MSKNIYIVECSAGSFDSFRTYISGVYDELGLAEELKDKLNAENLKIREEFNRLRDPQNPDDMSPAQDDFYYRNQQALEFNKAEVVTYILNKEIKHGAN